MDLWWVTPLDVLAATALLFVSDEEMSQVRSKFVHVFARAAAVYCLVEAAAWPVLELQ